MNFSFFCELSYFGIQIQEVDFQKENEIKVVFIKFADVDPCFYSEKSKNLFVPMKQKATQNQNLIQTFISKLIKVWISIKEYFSPKIFGEKYSFKNIMLLGKNRQVLSKENSIVLKQIIEFNIDPEFCLFVEKIQNKCLFTIFKSQKINDSVEILNEQCVYRCEIEDISKIKYPENFISAKSFRILTKENIETFYATKMKEQVQFEKNDVEKICFKFFRVLNVTEDIFNSRCNEVNLFLANKICFQKNFECFYSSENKEEELNSSENNKEEELISAKNKEEEELISSNLEIIKTELKKYFEETFNSYSLKKSSRIVIPKKIFEDFKIIQTKEIKTLIDEIEKEIEKEKENEKENEKESKKLNTKNVFFQIAELMIAQIKDEFYKSIPQKCRKIKLLCDKLNDAPLEKFLLSQQEIKKLNEFISLSRTQIKYTFDSNLKPIEYPEFKKDTNKDLWCSFDKFLYELNRKIRNLKEDSTPFDFLNAAIEYVKFIEENYIKYNNSSYPKIYSICYDSQKHSIFDLLKEIKTCKLIKDELKLRNESIAIDLFEYFETFKFSKKLNSLFESKHSEASEAIKKAELELQNYNKNQMKFSSVPRQLDKAINIKSFKPNIPEKYFIDLKERILYITKTSDDSKYEHLNDFLEKYFEFSEFLKSKKIYLNL